MNLFAQLIRHGLVISGSAVCIGATLAQPAPIAANAVTFSPANPQEFEAFTVTIEFSKPYCVAENSPLFSRVSLVGTELVLLLSQLGAGPCVNRKSFVIPGIPAGNFRVTVGVTGPHWTNFSLGTRSAVSVEQSTVPLVVSAVGPKTPFYTWVAPAEPRALSGLSLVPGVPGDTIQNGTVSLLGTQGDYEFMAWSPYPSSSPVPKAAVRLYSLSYPWPLNGSFQTTSLTDANRLLAEGFTRFSSSEYYVLPKVNEVCPLGSKPVYRLFNARAIAHRYVASFDTYSALAANGWIGEGSVFCAPPND